MLNTTLQTRRRLLKSTAIGFGHLALTALLQKESSARNDARPLAAKQPHLAPRAKRIVFLFMKGGPSHVDTFDPKPALDRDHGKPLPFDLPRVTFANPTSKLELKTGSAANQIFVEQVDPAFSADIQCNHRPEA